MTSFENTEIAFKSKTDSQLKKAYWLFKIISFPIIVKIGKLLTPIALKLHLPIKGLIKSTIFSQFCGGESINECSKTIENLGKFGVGTILDYSVEGQESLEEVENTVQEIIKTIERGANDPNIPFAVFKVTGVASFSLLEKASSSITLTQDELKEFEEIEHRVERICQRAFDCNLPVFIDAEESWIQQAIDDIAFKMMCKFNQERAIVYNTIQMYRWDRFEFLKGCLLEAKNHRIIYGVKLVRGAYMEKERKRAAELGYSSPIQIDKSATDTDYNLALSIAFERINSASVIVASHNEKSSLLAADLASKANISPNHSHLHYSQLYGMSDNLTFNLADAGFNVSKYLPFGPVDEVIPYLMRRAQENSSVSGQTSRELQLLNKECKRRGI